MNVLSIYGRIPIHLLLIYNKIIKYILTKLVCESSPFTHFFSLFLICILKTAGNLYFEYFDFSKAPASSTIGKDIKVENQRILSTLKRVHLHKKTHTVSL